MAFKLPPAVYSPQLLESVTYDIEQYLAWYRESKVQKRLGAPLADEPTHSAETVLTIETWLVDKKPTVELLEQLIAELRRLATDLPTIHITLAALPNHAQRSQFVDWFRAQAGGQSLLLTFVADRNLGGGIIVRTPNRLFDYSWKQQLIAGREKMAEIVSRAG